MLPNFAVPILYLPKITDVKISRWRWWNATHKIKTFKLNSLVMLPTDELERLISEDKVHLLITDQKQP